MLLTAVLIYQSKGEVSIPKQLRIHFMHQLFSDWTHLSIFLGNVLNELEKALQDLEEIKGYLKISRVSIMTLGFLRALRAINGSELDRGQ